MNFQRKLSTLFLSIIIIPQIACTVVREKSASGDEATFIALGGKGAWRKGVGVVYNNEKSFRDGMVAAGLAVSAAQAAHSVAATETTKQITERQATARIINNNNNATVVEQARIAADVTKATFVAP